jgi:hypothetical protein
MDLFESIEYNINSLELSIPRGLMNDSSKWTRTFIEIASGKSQNGYYSWGQLFNKPWCEDQRTLDFFDKSLSNKDKIEVLKFYTSHIHELTHHTDMLITPFGINYQSKLLREYLNLQDFYKEVANNNDFIGDWTRLIDLDFSKTPLENFNISSIKLKWEQLKGQLYYFDALFDFNNWGKRNLKIGWNQDTNEISIFKKSYKKVTVRDFFLTIQISDNGDYLTPIAILECRAILNSIRWIISCFGVEYSKPVIELYYRHIYSELGSSYRFILDLLADLHNLEKFEDLIEKYSINYLDSIFKACLGCCWYALNAPPPMNQNSLHNSNPVARLIISLKELGKSLKLNKPFSPMPEFLDYIDSSEDAQDLYFVPIDEILAYCQSFITLLEKLNIRDNKNQEMREHFNWILMIQKKLIQKRLNSESPYASLVGLAENGNPLFGIEDHELDWLIFDRPINVEVKKWFNDRSLILFSLNKKSDLLLLLKKHFKNHT